MRNGPILAVDLGGSSLRAALVRLDGTILSSFAVALTIDEPRAGWAEVDPALWWRALQRAVARLLPAGPKVAAICVCAMTRSQVFLDGEGRTLGRAILFRDRRAAAIARELDGATAFDARARLAWTERHHPGRFTRIASVIEPKDYLNFRLTGIIAADSVTASRAMSSSPAGSDAIALPALTPANVIAPWQQVGAVRQDAIPRLAGVPVFAGALDTWACAIGAGAVTPGQGYDVAGTSEAVGLVTAHPVTAAGLVRIAWTERTHHIGGPTQAGADCARWCHDTFRLRGTLADAIARVGAKLRADAPLFLPYLAGERTPVWSSTVRGAFHGIDRAHGPDDFLWSTLEGVAHAVRDILRIAQEAAALRMHELRVCGGGARADAWCALKADVLGVPVLRSRAAETGVVGAAMAAAVGLGVYPDLARAARRMAPVERRFNPHARYADAYARRAAAYDAIRRTALDLVHPE